MDIKIVFKQYEFLLLNTLDDIMRWMWIAGGTIFPSSLKKHNIHTEPTNDHYSEV